MTPDTGRLRRLEGSGATSQFRTLSSAPRMLRVPPASAIKAVVTSSAGGRNEVTISWLQPVDPDVDGYEVWVKTTAQPTRAAFVSQSPAYVSISVGANVSAVVYISTIMKNGSRLALDLAPTTTAALTA